MIVNLDQIERFAQCPRSHKYYKEEPLLTVMGLRQSIIESVVKRCHIDLMRTEEKTVWRDIVGYVDAAVFTDIDITNKESSEAGKILAENVLKSLQQWYHKVYPQLNYETFTDIRLEQHVKGHVVICEVPIIQLAEHPSITLVGNKEWNVLRMYNDYKVRGLAWAVANELDDSDITVVYLGTGTKGGLRITPLALGKEDHARTGVTLECIVEAMSNRVDYPSVSDHCIMCPYIGRCRL